MRRFGHRRLFPPVGSYFTTEVPSSARTGRLLSLINLSADETHQICKTIIQEQLCGLTKRFSKCCFKWG